MTREERMNEELARLVGTLQAENAELKKDIESTEIISYDRWQNAEKLERENAELKKKIETLSAAVKKFFFHSLNPK